MVVGDGEEGRCFVAGFDSVAGTGDIGDSGDVEGEEGVLDHEMGPFGKKAQIDASSCQTGQRFRTLDKCSFASVAIRLLIRSQTKMVFKRLQCNSHFLKLIE